MSDLISRQAVIDLVSKFIVEIISEGGRDLNAHTNDVLRQIVRNISSDRVLPPVQPKKEDNTMDIYSDLLRVKHGTMSIDSLIDKVWCRERR